MSTERLLRVLRSFPAPVWVVSFAVLLNRSVGFLTLFAAIYFHRFALDPVALAAVLFAVGAAGVAGSLLGGRLAERLGSRTVLLAGSLVNVGVLAGMAVATDRLVVSVVLATVSVAATQSFIAPSMTVVTESGYRGPTVTVVAFFRIFLNVGSIVAPLVFVWLGAERFPLLLGLSAVGSALTAVLIGRTGRRSGPAVDTAAPAPPPHRGTGDVRVWTVVGVFAVTIAVYAQHQSGIPLSVGRLPEGDRLFAVLLLVNPLVIVLGELPLSTLVARLRWNVGYAAGVLATAVGLAVTGLSGAWWLCLVGFVVFSVGEAVFAPLASSSVAELARPGTNARHQGHLSAAQSLGMAVGPAVGAWGVLTDRVAFWWAVVLVGLVCAGAALLAGARSPSRKEPTRVAVP